VPNVRIITVCLPKTADVEHLATTATHTLATVRAADQASLAGHFATSVRRFGRRLLVQPFQGSAAGGRIDKLDLNTMRTQARNTYWWRWQIWHQVVAGTPIAKPFWVLASRHRANPTKYSLQQAQHDYLGQPRIQAMLIYNALPTKLTDLPTNHLEALQTGAHSYAHLGWLSAVPGHAMVTTDGTYLTPASDRFADIIAFLTTANNHLTSLGTTGHLVALACPQ
jgi:hypothetical protein